MTTVLEKLGLIMEEQGHYGAMLVPYQVIKDAMEEIIRLQIRVEDLHKYLAGESI